VGRRCGDRARIDAARMSRDEYIATEPDSEGKREFVNGEAFSVRSDRTSGSASKRPDCLPTRT
jgi:hypothetical protein